MAETARMPASDEIRARWGGFAFTAENEAQAKVIVGRYPLGRASAICAREIHEGRVA